jgi:hypothetical protein
MGEIIRALAAEVNAGVYGPGSADMKQHSRRQFQNKTKPDQSGSLGKGCPWNDPPISFKPSCGKMLIREEFFTRTCGATTPESLTSIPFLFAGPSPAFGTACGPFRQATEKHLGKGRSCSSRYLQREHGRLVAPRV